MRLTKYKRDSVLGRCVIFGLISMFAILIGISLSSCSDASSVNDSDRPRVVSTIFPAYDFARNVAGEYAEVELLVDVTDSHSYSPTVLDMVAIEECDIFIYTGGEGDLWAEDFLSTIDHSDKIIINMLDASDHLYIESTDGHSHDDSDAHTHEHEHEHAHDHAHEHKDQNDVIYDEHVWLSPVNAISITGEISDALCRIDPDHAESYRTNTSEYQAELHLLDGEFRSLVENAERNSIVVADKFPFLYLCEDYGISYCAALPGCSSAADLSAVDFDELSDHLREEDLSVILTAEYSDSTIARTVKRESEKKELEILELHSCHTLTKGQITDGSSYLSLMRENIKVLERALG